MLFFLRKDTEYTPQMHYFECMLDIEGHINQGRSCKNWLKGFEIKLKFRTRV